MAKKDEVWGKSGISGRLQSKTALHPPYVGRVNSGISSRRPPPLFRPHSALQQNRKNHCSSALRTAGEQRLGQFRESLLRVSCPVSKHINTPFSSFLLTSHTTIELQNTPTPLQTSQEHIFHPNPSLKHPNPSSNHHLNPFLTSPPHFIT